MVSPFFFFNMPKEIERKFLLQTNNEFQFANYPASQITQGYLAFDGNEIRVRMRLWTTAESYTLTIKQGSGIEREELEFDIPEEVAIALVRIASPYVIRKRRYEVGRWELDFFEDAVSPPIVEIELESKNEKLPYHPLAELGREVTDDPAFVNRNIALRVGSYAMAKDGYHLRHIPKGILGEVSKIREEVEELEDATIQGNRILQLVELSDIIGAVRHFAVAKGTTLEECVAMADATERAFKAGQR